MSGLLKKFNSFWDGEGGAHHILQVAFPLILSSSSFTVMQFVDRKFLLIYSKEAFQAAAPAGMLSFTIMALFFGTVNYINTFVAQYTGAKKHSLVAVALWQGLYFALIGYLCILPFSGFASELFLMIGHSKEVAFLEAQYFKILIYGSGLVLINQVLSAFFSGRGKTKVVMWVRFLGMSLNLPLDYLLIFGGLGIAPMGIEGAAYATIISTGFVTLLFCALILRPKNQVKFQILANYRFHLGLFKRLIKYGLPSGVQFIIDIFGMSFFILMVGRLGEVELLATNAVWSLNLLVFLPMIGMVIAITTLVGKSIGAEDIKLAERITANSFVLVFSYMLFVGSLFVAAPHFFLSLILTRNSDGSLTEIYDLGTILLRFVALYSVFNAIGMVFSSAIKGAGDTRYVMRVSFIISATVLVAPSYLTSTVWPMPASIPWAFATSYICIMGLVFYWRYRQKHWMKIKVI
ncbi:MAG: MATE family efflux transporter [Bacteriovoracaceae bacterium]|nr:MATE family efflux transporter [Bacteriovoracaceae bacterium]